MESSNEVQSLQNQINSACLAIHLGPPCHLHQYYFLKSSFRCRERLEWQSTALGRHDTLQGCQDFSVIIDSTNVPAFDRILGSSPIAD